MYRTSYAPTHLVDADPLVVFERELHSQELGGDGRGEGERLALSQRRPGGVAALQLQGVAVVGRARCDDEGVDRPGQVVTRAEPCARKVITGGGGGQRGGGGGGSR